MKSEIEVRVIFSRRKTISLALQRNGSFELRAPIGTSKKVIEAFLEDKKEWLVKHRNAYEEREALLKECLNFVFQRGRMCLLSGTNRNGTREKGSRENE